MTLTFSKSDLLSQIFATLIVTAEQECGVSCCDVIGSQQCFPSVKDRENSQWNQPIIIHKWFGTISGTRPDIFYKICHIGSVIEECVGSGGCCALLALSNVYSLIFQPREWRVQTNCSDPPPNWANNSRQLENMYKNSIWRICTKTQSALGGRGVHNITEVLHSTEGHLRLRGLLCRT